MKKQHLILALSISALTSVLSAQGRPPGGGQGGPGGPGGGQGGPGGRQVVPPIIAALDLSKDGTIDAKEIEKAPQSLLKLDKNHDGKLTEEEYRPKPPGGQGGPAGGKGGPGGGQGGPQGGPGGGPGQGGPGGPGGQRPVPPIIAALDTNKDGVIDADEIAKAAESLKTLDKNGDGKLTEDEYRPKPLGGPGGPGGKGGPEGKGGAQGGPKGPPPQ
ncbi:MAG: EF-hand domain-containing protein [Chthoniobacteraceae bacterium]